LPLPDRTLTTPRFRFSSCRPSDVTGGPVTTGVVAGAVEAGVVEAGVVGAGAVGPGLLLVVATGTLGVIGVTGAPVQATPFNEKADGTGFDPDQVPLNPIATDPPAGTAPFQPRLVAVA
jgi:hypothetical protein